MSIWRFPKNGGTPEFSKISPFWYWNLHGLPPNSATPFQFPCHLKSLMGITSGPVFNLWSKRHRPCVLLPLALPMLGFENRGNLEWQTGKIEPNWKQPGCVAKHRVAAINLFCHILSYFVIFYLYCNIVQYCTILYLSIGLSICRSIYWYRSIIDLSIYRYRFIDLYHGLSIYRFFDLSIYLPMKSL